MFKNYLKTALRNLLKYKSYSVINVLGFAVGMACCILILLFVVDELSFDRFHANADRIYRIAQRFTEEGNSSPGIARVGSPWGPALKELFAEVEDYVRFRYVGTVLVQKGEKRFYEENGLYADSSVFNVFSFDVLAGDPRTALRNPDNIVVTESMARRYFGAGDPLGQTLLVDNGRSQQVSAVIADVPANAHFHFDYLVPFQVHEASRPDWMGEWQVQNYHVYLLLRSSTDAAGLTAKLPDFLATHIEDPEAAAGIEAFLQPLTSIHLHSNLFREFETNGDIRYVYVFAAVALLVLFVACVNFMNLATARSASRFKEVGLRKVVGAQRWQLIVQFTSEALLTGFVALALALFMSELSLPVFNELAAKQMSLRFFLQPQWGLMLLGVTFLVGTLSGIYPAFYLTHLRPVAILKGDGGGTPRGKRLRQMLVVAQFAASVVLIIGAAMIYRQVHFMENFNPGFNREQMLVIPINDNTLLEHTDAVRAELQKISGVRGVTLTSGNMGGGDWGVPMTFERNGEAVKEGTRMMNVDHGYVSVMEMQIAQGRDFSREFPTDATHSFLVNETAAKLLGADNVLGKQINVANGWREGPIVGVVKDFNYRSLHEPVLPIVFFIVPENFQYFYVRMQPGEIKNIIAAIEPVWQKFSPNYPFRYSFMDDTFDQFYRNEIRLGTIIGYATGLAVFVACIGLLGLAAFSAETRTREIGLRKVLGASLTEIVRLISSDFVKLVLLANVIAWPLAFWLMRGWLENFAYRANLALWLFVLAGFVAIALAVLTASSQALRVGRRNPADTLRYE